MNLKKTIPLVILALAFIASPGIFLCSAAESYPAVVEDLSQDKYLPKVKEALKNAKSSIDMAMFFVNFYPTVKNSPVNQLVEELISAHNRGVKNNYLC